MAKIDRSRGKGTKRTKHFQREANWYISDDGKIYYDEEQIIEAQKRDYEARKGEKVK